MLLLLALAASLNMAVVALLAWAWRKPPVQAQEAATHVPVSLLIAAKDEAENLGRFLPFVLAQDYPGEWEVVVALDRCTDHSAQVIAQLQVHHPRLRTVVIDTLPQGWTGKKHALHQAILVARHECLALTDADCELPPSWLRGMARQFSQGKDLVLGVSPYAPAPGFLNLFIRFETWMTAILYVGLAFWRLPYMGVGRSMGYRKAWFQAVGGFDQIAHSVSGDDDLLVNHASRSVMTGLLTAWEAQVVSQPKRTWGEWLRQKRRHSTAATGYKPASLLILLAIHGLQLIFYLSLILVVLCVPAVTGWALMIYLLRATAMMAILAMLPWRHKTALWLAFPLLDVAYLIYLVLLPFAAARKQPKWK